MFTVNQLLYFKEQTGKKMQEKLETRKKKQKNRKKLVLIDLLSFRHFDELICLLLLLNTGWKSREKEFNRFNLNFHFSTLIN